LRAQDLIVQIHTDVAEAKDNLFQAKVFQTHYANLNRSPDIPFQLGDKVMLSTLHTAKNTKRRVKNEPLSFSPVMTDHMTLLMYMQHHPTIPSNYPTHLTHTLLITHLSLNPTYQMIPTSSRVANCHNHYLSSPLMDSKNSSFKKSLILVDRRPRVAISRTLVGYGPNTTAGSQDLRSRTAKHLAYGLENRFREQPLGSFFPLGFLMHPIVCRRLMKIPYLIFF